MFEIQTGSTNPILRTVCKPVTDFDENLVKTITEMEETMLGSEGSTEVRGVGLAANQVGIDARIILITLNVQTKKEHKVIAMVNPEILEQSKEGNILEEGCLSLPETFGKVKRPAKVKVRWQNEKGNWCERKFYAWDARIFLHEYDHLEGKMFIDYLKEDQIRKD